jgi:hypothetical protein
VGLIKFFLVYSICAVQFKEILPYVTNLLGCTRQINRKNINGPQINKTYFTITLSERFKKYFCSQLVILSSIEKAFAV